MSFKVHLNFWDDEYGASLELSKSYPVSQIELVENQNFDPIEIQEKSLKISDYSFIFIDGVMRKEAEFNFEAENNSFSKAFFYSIASGALKLQPAKLNLLEDSLLLKLVKRLLILEDNAGSRDFFKEYQSRFDYFKDFLNVDNVLSDLTVIFVDDINNAHEEAINAMRALENDVYLKLVDRKFLSDNSIVLMDGNLRVAEKEQPVLGFIKSIKRAFPDKNLFNKNSLLSCGQNRSALFKIKEKQNRYSWYIRLADEKSSVSWYNSLARLECNAFFDLEKVQQLADISSLFLPQFVLPKSARFPQELTAISALEKVLRQNLGNQSLIKNFFRELFL